MYDIEEFTTPGGRNPYFEWRARLRDQKAKLAVDRRLIRLQLGNFGDHRFCRNGVWELKIDVGPGYRIYYALVGEKIVLLLCAGDKRTQSSDIDRACEFFAIYKGEQNAER